MTTANEVRTIQVWPSGRGYEYQGDPTQHDCPLPHRYPLPRLRRTERLGDGKRLHRWRQGQASEWVEILASLRAERYLDREVLKCDSMLVSAHLQHHDALPDELEQEWTFENITGLYPDPSEWTVDDCHEWLEERGIAIEDDDDVYALVQDNADPAEIFEWWAVTEWLAGELTAIGQPVLDNAYGYWWGRCTTGQAVLMDGTLQEIARRHA